MNTRSNRRRSRNLWALAAATGAALMAGSAHASLLYWDSNGTGSSGAGSAPAGTWGTSNFWNSDSGGGGGTLTTTTAITDDLYFVAGPAVDSGNTAYTVTVATGTTQSAQGLYFQSSGAATLSGGTGINLGAHGINIPQYAFGTTANGIVTINSALVLQAAQTWTNNSSVTMRDQSTLSLNGQTLTVAGSGNTYIQGAISGLSALPTASFIKNGAGVLFFGTGFGNTVGSGISLNNGAFWYNNNLQVPSAITFNGGSLRDDGQATNNFHLNQTWTVNAGGATLDIYNGTQSFNNTNGFSSTITGGTSLAPVTIFKIGTAGFQVSDNASITNSLNARLGVYGGNFSFTSGTSTVQTNARIYSADIVGGILYKYNQNGTQNNLDSGFTASVGSSGGSIGGLYWYTTAAVPITGGNGGMLVLQGSLPSPFPDMSSLGGGKMWLGGDRVLTSLAANSDGVYRLLGSDIATANVLNGSNSVMIGAGANMLNGNPTHNPTVSAPQNFTGSLTIAGRFTNNSGINTGNAVLNLTQNNGTPATMLGTTSVNIGPDATLSITANNNNATTAYLNSAAVVSLNTGRLFLKGDSGTTGINESITTLAVTGPSSLSFNTNNTTANANQLTVTNLNVPTGAYLTIQTPNATNNILGGANTWSPKLFAANFNGASTSGGISFIPSIRVNTGNNEFDGVSTWTKYSVTTGLTAFGAGDYTTNPTPASNGTTDATNADYTASLTMTASGSLQSIRFTSGNPTIDPGVGHTLNVLGGGILSNTVNGQIGNSTIANAGSLTTSAPALYINGGNQITINSKITGSFALVYNGNGLPVINNTSNDFVGNVYINSSGGSMNIPGDGIFGFAGDANHAPNQIFFNGAAVTGITGTSWTTSRTINIGAGGVLFNLNSPTNQFIFNGKVTGSGPINIGTSGQPTQLTLGSSSNDFTGLVYMAGQTPSNANGNPAATNIRTSAANVLGNNASYVTSQYTAIDMTNAGAAPNGFSQTVGSIEGSGNVILGATAVLTVGSNSLPVGVPNKDGVYSGNISGGGGLTKAGTGTLSLTANQLYTGPTTITGGTLRLLTTGGAYNSDTLHGNIAKSSSIIVGDTSGHWAATLDVSAFNGKATEFTVGSGTAQTVWGWGRILGNTTIGGLGQVTPGDATTAGTLTIDGTAAFAAGMALNYNVNALTPGASDLLSVIHGGLTLPSSGQVMLNVSGVSGTAVDTGTYTLLTTASGITNFSSDNFNVTGVPTSLAGNVTLSGDGKSLLLQVTNPSSGFTWTGARDNTWDTSTAAPTNWKKTSDNSTVAYSEPADILFADGGANTSIAITAGGVSPSKVTFTNSSATSYSLSGPITGSGQLVMNSTAGTGSATLASPNSYTGGTTVRNGTLIAADPGALGSTVGTVTLAGGTLDLATDASVIAYNITVSGTATLQSDKATASSPGITHSLGTLSIGANQLNIAAGPKVTGGAPVVAFASTSLTGTATINATTANVALGAVSGSGRNLVLQGTATANTLGAITTGTGTVTINSGAWALTAGGSFTGGVTLNGGTLRVSHAAGLGTGTLTLNGGTLGNTTGGSMAVTTANPQTWGGDFAYNAASDLNLGTGAVSLGANAGTTRTITVAGAGTLRVGGAISNGTNSTTPTTALSVSATGTGSLIVAGASTYTGGTTITSGARLIALNTSGSATGTGNVAVQNGGTLGGSGTISLGALSTLSVQSGGHLSPHLGTGLTTATFNVNGASGVGLTGAILDYDLGASGVYDSVYVNGPLAIAGTTTLNITALPGFDPGSGTAVYKLFTSSMAITATPANFTIGTNTGSHYLNYSFALANANTELDLQVTRPPSISQTWAGVGGEWDHSTTGNWTPSPGVFGEFNTVTFDNSGYGNTTVNVTETVVPNSITVNSDAGTANYAINSTTGKISGTTGIAKSGTSTLTLTGLNDFSGAVNVTAGVLSVANFNSLGDSSSGNVITLGDSSNSATLAFTGASGVNSRQITVGSAGATFIATQSGASVTHSGALTGSGDVTVLQSATGTTAFSSSANTLTGSISVQQGLLSVGSMGVGASGKTLALGTGGASADFTYTGATSLSDSRSLAFNTSTITVTNSAATLTFPTATGNSLTMTGNGGLTITAPLNLTGSLTVTGGKLTLPNNTNSFPGGISISGGTLVAGTGGSGGTTQALGTATVSMTGGTLRLSTGGGSGGVQGFSGSNSGNWNTNPTDRIDSLNNVLNIVKATESNVQSTYAWQKTPQSISRFVASFTYTPTFANLPAGDGMAFVVQNSSSTWSAGTGTYDGGGNLGYGPPADSTIKPSAAIFLDFYTYSRTGLGTNGTVNLPSANNTGDVDLRSQHPIAVTLAYNGTTLAENLVDTITGQSFTTSYALDLVSLLGSTTGYIGFTGGAPGWYTLAATQTISNFSFGAGQITYGNNVTVSGGTTSTIDSPFYISQLGALSIDGGSTLAVTGNMVKFTSTGFTGSGNHDFAPAAGTTVALGSAYTFTPSPIIRNTGAGVLLLDGYYQPLSSLSTVATWGPGNASTGTIGVIGDSFFSGLGVIGDTAQVNLASGSTLAVAAASSTSPVTLDGPVSLAGDATISAQSLPGSATTGTITFGGFFGNTLTLAAGRTLTLNAAAGYILSVGEVLNGDSTTNIAVTGGGTVALTGDDTRSGSAGFAGAASISGTLALQNANALISAKAINVLSGGTLDVQVLAANLSAVNVVTGGALQLSQDQAGGTAPTAAIAGTLRIAASQGAGYNLVLGAGSSFQATSGSHIFAGNLSVTGATTFGGSSDLIVNGTFGGSAGSLSVNSPSSATLTLTGAATTLAGLTLTKGTLALAATGGGSAKSLVTSSLAVAAGGKVDLNDNVLVVKAGTIGTYTAGTGYNGVTGLVASGYGGGLWNGTTGIVSTAALSLDPGLNHGLAVLTGQQAHDNGNAGILAAGAFHGQTVVGADVLVQYGWNGDLNMDGQVTYLDYGVIDNAYLNHAAASYAHGDLNFDGAINYLDYGMMDNAYLAQTAPHLATAAAAMSSAVPEPAALALLGIGALGLLGRRRRN